MITGTWSIIEATPYRILLEEDYGGMPGVGMIVRITAEGGNEFHDATLKFEELKPKEIK